MSTLIAVGVLILALARTLFAEGREWLPLVLSLAQAGRSTATAVWPRRSSSAARRCQYQACPPAPGTSTKEPLGACVHRSPTRTLIVPSIT